MSWIPDLDELIGMVTEAHMGQHDKAGQPYILHPLRVMFLMMDCMDDWRLPYVALCHDLIEDTDVTEITLRKEWCLDDEIVDAIVCLTRNTGETYSNYLIRCKANPLAKKVKIADLMDHLRNTSCLGPTQIERYKNGLSFLIS